MVLRLLFRQRCEELASQRAALSRQQNRALLAIAERRWDDALRAIAFAREAEQILKRMEGEPDA